MFLLGLADLPISGRICAGCLPTLSGSATGKNLQSQTKIVGTLPPNAVFSLLARLLVLPMLFIAVNSPNLVHQH